jgi:hypothetical protein
MMQYFAKHANVNNIFYIKQMISKYCFSIPISCKLDNDKKKLFNYSCIISEILSRKRLGQSKSSNFVYAAKLL